MKVEAQNASDQTRLIAALTDIAAHDSKASFVVDAGNGEILVGGISELHLDGIIAQLKTEGLALKLGAPQVDYRETITRKVTKDYTHKRLSFGAAQFARVILEIEPNQGGAGNVFTSKIPFGAIPENFIPGIEKGVNSVLANGALMGMPVANVKVTLIHGAYHDEDSSLLTFEIAARAALREAFDAAGAVLLEPIMDVEITSPEHCIGSVIRDLHSRRGLIVDTSMRDQSNIIKAKVPLANMFGYWSTLNQMSRGMAKHTMEYCHHEIISPPDDDPDNFPPAIGMRA